MPARALTPPRLASSRRRSFLIRAALFAFFLTAYLFSASADYFSTGDTTIRIQLAQNIEGRFAFDLHGWKLQYPHHVKKEWLDPRIDIGREGKTYSTYLLGQPALIVPFDKVAGALAVHERWPYGPATLMFDRLVGPFVGALEIFMFFLFAFQLGYGFRRTLVLTCIFAFATMCWPDAESVLEHTLIAFSLLFAMYHAFRFRDQLLGWPHLIFAGVGIGGAVVTRYQDAFLGLIGLGVYLLLPGSPWPGVWGRIRQCLLVGVGIIPFLGLDVFYNWARYGKLYASGHHETVFGYTIWKGILGLSVSPGKGLLWYCPTIFLLAIAARPFIRRYSALSIAIASLTTCFFLLYGYVTYWHGDPAWGPRYVYPVVPFLTLPLGELLRWQGSRKQAVWAATLLVVLAGFVVQVAAVSVSPWRSWYRVISYEEQHGHLWQWIAARYDYHWNVHESPLNFQVRGLYQMAHDSFLHSHEYELVPPDEDPILDRMTVDYAINQWNFWWGSNEFNWWMGRDKIVSVAVALLALMLASGTYLAGEAIGVFSAPTARSKLEPEREEAA